MNDLNFQKLASNKIRLSLNFKSPRHFFYYCFTMLDTKRKCLQSNKRWGRSILQSSYQKNVIRKEEQQVIKEEIKNLKLYRFKSKLYTVMKIIHQV